MELPKFKYHPDPIQTGSVISSSETCTNCGKRRGFVYIGPIYGTEDTEEPSNCLRLRSGNKALAGK